VRLDKTHSSIYLPSRTQVDHAKYLLAKSHSSATWQDALKYLLAQSHSSIYLPSRTQVSTCQVVLKYLLCQVALQCRLVGSNLVSTVGCSNAFGWSCTQDQINLYIFGMKLCRVCWFVMDQSAHRLGGSSSTVSTYCTREAFNDESWERSSWFSLSRRREIYRSEAISVCNKRESSLNFWLEDNIFFSNNIVPQPYN